MADLAITAANVQHASGARLVEGLVAGAAITAGQAVYKDSSNELQPAQADAAATDAVVGIATHDAAAGQPLTYQAGGDIDLGATLAVGEVYCLSAAAAGGIAPVGDLGTGEYVTVLGIATTTSNLKLGINVGSAQHA